MTDFFDSWRKTSREKLGEYVRALREEAAELNTKAENAEMLIRALYNGDVKKKVKKVTGGEKPAPAAKLHWTQRPENRKRVMARVKAMQKASDKKRSQGW